MRPIHLRTSATARRLLALTATGLLLTGCGSTSVTPSPVATAAAETTAPSMTDEPLATTAGSPAPTDASTSAPSASATTEPSANPTSTAAPTAAHDPRWETVDALPTGRGASHALLLADGRVLVVGNDGTRISGDRVRPDSAHVEAWNPTRDRWATRTPLNAPRGEFAAITLVDGRVLVAGGLNEGDGGCGNGGNLSFSSSYLYDPATDTWTKQGLMSTARTAPSIALLPDGRVLVAGGYFHDTQSASSSGEDTAITATLAVARVPVGGPGGSGAGADDVVPEPFAHALATAEIFDPATGTWARTGAMRYARYGADAVTLADGRILVAGSGPGEEDGVASVATGANRSAEIYDPATGHWSLTGGFPEIDLGKLKADGKPSWVNLSDPAPYANGHLVALADGGALLVGNAWWWKHAGDFDRVLRFDAGSGSWSTVGVPWFTVFDPADTTSWTSPGRSTRDATAVVLRDGRVLIAGGAPQTDIPNEAAKRSIARLYNPATDHWTRLPDMPGPKSASTGVLLSDGSVLLVGGYHDFDGLIWLDCIAHGGDRSVYRFIP